jgi:cyclic pyranopterin phosphate synthase
MKNIYNNSKHNLPAEKETMFSPQIKVLYHLNKVENFLQDKKVDPITIEIDPSNACNHSCPFCISGHLHLSKYKGTEFFNRQMMSKEILMNLVKDLSKTETDSINFTGGGEPTMNPHLKDAIEYLKNNSNIEMGMFTNGTMLSRFDLYETVVTSLTWVRISLDSGVKEKYDKLRVTNSSNNFDMVIENIKKLIEYKKKLKSKIAIGVGFVVTRDNFDEVLTFANLFKDIDVDYCQYKPEIIQVERNLSDNKKDQIPAKFWANKVVNLLYEASKILGNKFQCNSYKIEDLIMDKNKEYGREYKQCLGSQFQPCIGADGEVYVCTSHRGHTERSYGNLKDKSFIQIWNDVKKRKEVMNTIENKEKFSKCSQLCKPHESNKVLWKIKQNIHKPGVINSLKEKCKKYEDKIIHKNFI